MSLRTHLLKGLLITALLSGQAVADRGDSTSYLSYYTYYKTKPGETVSDVARKFGLAESSFLRMNPQLREEEELPEGSLVCVPQKEEPKVAVAKNKPKSSVKEESNKKPSPAKKSSSNKSKVKAKETDEPSEEEWNKLAELATNDAPEVSLAPPPPPAPTSRFIGSDGRVVYIPTAKPIEKPAPKRENHRRVELSSRKGKAIHEVLKTCRSYMGTPYVWGGEQPGGFDCSGYVQYVFAKHGYNLPRTADIQFEVGKSVKRGEEKPGDLVFFETYAPGASHVGVYLGRGYFIHASSSRGVTVERLATDFFAQRYLGAKRQNF